MNFLTRRFAKAPEGTAALFFIQIFATLGFAVLYSTLVLYATKHLHLGVKAATSVDGRVRRIQLRPAPLRRLPGRPFSFEPQTVCRKHGAAGDRLRLHRDRHATAVLRRPRPLPHRQRLQRHLHQHDADAALHPGGSAPRRSLPLELRRHECRLLRRVQRRRLFPGDRELLEPLHLCDAWQFRLHHPRAAHVEDARRPQHHAARRYAKAVPRAPARRPRHCHGHRSRRVVYAAAARQHWDDPQRNLRRGGAHVDLSHGPPLRIAASGET